MNDGPPLMPWPILALHYLTLRQSAFANLLAAKVPVVGVNPDDPDIRQVNVVFAEISSDRRYLHRICSPDYPNAQEA